MLYRLNKADAALAEVLPACEWRRDNFAVRAVQALAFTRWKQGRFREALEHFHQMEGWMGKNAALCENIGHTYNTIGAYDEAERYFQDALVLTRALADGASSNEGGILLGLAGVQDRRGNQREALPTAIKSYEFFKTRDTERGWDTSLTAKAAMQVSKLQLALGDLTEAERLAREAVRIFQVTAGEDTPLLVGALERLGSILVKRHRKLEARKAYHQAYKVASTKDAMDLVELLEIHHALLDTHLAEAKASGLDRAAFKKHFGIAERIVRRIRSEVKQDGNAGAYYKAAGELFVLGGNCAKGRSLLTEAVELFRPETAVDTTGLIRQCTDLIALCDSSPGSEPAAAAARDGGTSTSSAGSSSGGGAASGLGSGRWEEAQTVGWENDEF